MNIKELKEIIEIFEGSDITELDLERQGVKIRLKKNTAAGSPVVEIEQEDRPAAAAEAVLKAKDAGLQGEEKNLLEIRAPMVGTFYRVPSPEAEPFVSEEDIVKEGDVICIIEAMKLMNEIKSEARGRIIKILVENGQAVEFNEPLFLLETE